MNDLVFMIFKNPFYWIVVVAGILSFFFYKKIVGFFGELWVRLELKKLSDDYLVINNLMIKNGDRTSQIDHVVVSKYGVFVIETKQYNGYIKGNDYDKNWLQICGNKRFFIHNPVHQNYGHVMALVKLLNIEESFFISLVCFSSNAKLNIKSDKVVPIYNLNKKIYNYKNIILRNYKEIYYYLLSINIVDKKERYNHIKNIKKKK